MKDTSHFDVGHVIKTPFARHLKTQYMAYAKDVILDRAIPNIYDGLKPVQRRIIYAMHGMGLSSKGAYKKSARTVGEVLGKYHAHGDSSVYGAMVTMAQDFTTKYQLVDGKGNWGSIDGDPPAAFRYCENKISPVSELMLKDIDKDTTEWQPNYDETLQEPIVLPTLFPNLLANGTNGIAVGLACSFAPHSVKAVYKAIDALLESRINHTQVTNEDLIDIVQAPDFPTGGVIINKDEVKEAYRTGQGKAIIRSNYHTEDNKKTISIVFTDIPYKQNKKECVKQIYELSASKNLTDIKDIRDESSMDGIRVVVECKKSSNIEYIVNNIFKYTNLQASFSMNHVALVGDKPVTGLTLENLLVAFVNHCVLVISRRSLFEKKKAQARYDIVSAIYKALQDKDTVMNLIKASNTFSDSVQAIMNQYSFNEKQAKAVVDLKVYKFNTSSFKDYETELEELETTIKFLTEILTDNTKMIEYVRQEVRNVASQFDKEERLTSLINISETNVDQRAYIKEEDIVVTVTHNNMIKAVLAKNYSSQNRGGKGVAITTKDDDFITNMYQLNTHDDLIFVTNTGRFLLLPAYKIPIVNKNAVGKYINNYITLEENEKIVDVLSYHTDDNSYILFVTKQGKMKRTSVADLPTKARAYKAIKLNESDELISCSITDSASDIIVATKNGMLLHVKADNINIQSRIASGVRGMNVADDDEIVSVSYVTGTDDILIMSSNGLGKLSNVSEYRITNRGAKGTRCYKVSDKSGYVVGVYPISNTLTTLIAITNNGQLIKVDTKNVPQQGRTAKGVKIIKLSNDDTVVAVCLSKEYENETTSPIENTELSV